MATLHLSCAADRGYVRHTAAMLHSVLEHRGGLDVGVHFLHGPDLPRLTRWQLGRMIRRLGGDISFIAMPDETVEGLPAFHAITRTMWYRIYLPELLPGIDRVLYLDGDTLAADSLEPLWATRLDDNLVGAVTNVFLRDEGIRSGPTKLGLPSLDAYFNSGVLLMNLDQMRREDTTAKLREFALSNELVYPDQDALNALMWDRRVRLHPRWNCMNSILTFAWADEVFRPEEIEEARARPGIRHFEGPGLNKPWSRGCEFKMRELYIHHRRGTPWPRVKLESDAEVS